MLRLMVNRVLVKYEENDFIQQYEDMKLFFKKYIGEPVFNPLISYPHIKTKYSIQIIDLRHQPDYITPKNYQLFQEYGRDPDIARVFLILIRRRQIE